MEIISLLIILSFAVLSAVLIWINLPGSFLMLAFIFVWAWIGDFALISPLEIMVIFGMLVMLEVLEFALGGLAAKYTGANKRSALMAMIGGLGGTILLGSLFFVVGAVVGLLAGSFWGAYWGEVQAGKSPHEARRAALGALMGSLAGKLLKSAATVILGVWMILEVI